MAAGRGYRIIWTVWEPSVMAAIVSGAALDA